MLFTRTPINWHYVFHMLAIKKILSVCTFMLSTNGLLIRDQVLSFNFALKCPQMPSKALIAPAWVRYWLKCSCCYRDCRDFGMLLPQL